MFGELCGSWFLIKGEYELTMAVERSGFDADGEVMKKMMKKVVEEMKKTRWAERGIKSLWSQQ